MKKLLIVAGLLLAFAGTAFGQSTTSDAHPDSGTPQIGAYGKFEVYPSSDSKSGDAAQNRTPLGFVLTGTYSTLTINMTTVVPSGETDGVVFGIFDKTTNTYMTCFMSPSDKSCTITSGAHFDGTNWTTLSSVTFNQGDEVYFTAYIPGTGHDGYNVQNLTWRLE